MAAHLSPKAFTFLRGLRRHNDRDWFEQRRAIYEQEVKAPMLDLATAINDAMVEFAPHHVRDPRRALLRIYRDIRFSADKSPYKTQAAAWWSHSRLQKTSGAGFYFHVSPEEVTIAAGVYMPARDQLLAIRRHLLQHHRELRRLLAAGELRPVLQEFEGRKLSRLPRGFNAADPSVQAAMDLLLCQQWGLSATLPAAVATQPTLIHEILSRFRLAAPVVHFLNAPLTAEAVRHGR